MSAPSDDTNHCSSRLKFRFASASVIPATERNSASIFNSSSIFCSTETVKGSILYGVLHSATTGFSGARRTSSRFTRAEARAISTARAAVASTAPRPSSADAANPHAPSAIARTLMPTDSASDALPTLPFLVRERAAAMRHHAHIRVARPAQRGNVQSPVGNVFHGENFNLTHERMSSDCANRQTICRRLVLAAHSPVICSHCSFFSDAHPIVTIAMRQRPGSAAEGAYFMSISTCTTAPHTLTETLEQDAAEDVSATPR